MSLYRFVGAATEVGEVKLSTFGQSVEFPDDLARDVILGGGSILPAAEFDAIGFTEQELSLYSNTYTHAEANAAFQAKKRRALLTCHETRMKLSAPKTPEPSGVMHEPELVQTEAGAERIPEHEEV